VALLLLDSLSGSTTILAVRDRKHFIGEKPFNRSIIRRAKEGFENVYFAPFSPNESFGLIGAHLIGGVFGAILCISWSADYLNSEDITLWCFSAFTSLAFLFSYFEISITLVFLDTVRCSTPTLLPPFLTISSYHCPFCMWAFDSQSLPLLSKNSI
jgi:hypothetical protein